ncbi:hypothetical protein SAMN05216480_1279 [Pustulibacterium marinum]|uniref:Uncharacterized protein n=1 Tax=Pustulibacterium marinum TaxID=1224947 RepID=A0A1I7IZX3_9FLAO|nr:hypothetical protein [Pustulibacterium marinum]SFU78442.1 hypothetical protein SAMN05216480_1279 [Pustulibacterium marinum]
MMDDLIRESLKNFFASTKVLMEQNVIRSSKYTADIAEYIIQEIYGLELCKSQREPGYDGTLNQKKYQIKINNSSQKTNQDVGDPELYDYFILIITSNSLLFDKKYTGYFMAIYEFEKKILEGKKYIAKTTIHQNKPTYLVTDEFQVKVMVSNNDVLFTNMKNIS